MKKLVFTLLMASATVFAQQSNPDVIKLSVPCATVDKVMELLKQYEERPLLQMIAERDKQELVTIMFVNPKTSTYSIVEQVNDKVYCVTGSGKGVMPYMGGAEVEEPKQKPKSNRQNKKEDVAS